MKQRTFLLPLLAFIVLLSSAGIMAQPGKGRGPKDGDRPHRMWADLKLSEEQKTQLKTLHDEMQTVRNKHFEAVKTVREKIKNELLKDAPSQNVLYGYAGELGELHKQMTKDRGDHLLKVKKVLTPEQFKSLIDKEGRMGEGKFGHKGKGKGCNGCPQKGNGNHGKGTGPHDGSGPGCDKGTPSAE